MINNGRRKSGVGEASEMAAGGPQIFRGRARKGFLVHADGADSFIFFI